MRRARLCCPQCEFLWPGVTGISIERGLVWVCGHTEAVAVREKDSMREVGNGAPKWCPLRRKP